MPHKKRQTGKRLSARNKRTAEPVVVKASPRSERFRFFAFLAASCLMLAFVSIGTIDYPVSQWIVANLVSPSADSPPGRILVGAILPFQLFGEWYFGCLLLAVVCLSDRKYRNAFWRLVFTCLVIQLLVVLIKHQVVRFRPEFFFDNRFSGLNETIRQTFGNASLPHGPHWDIQSFPSGHSAGACGVALILAALYPYYKPLFVFLAVMTMLQRIVGGYHFPSDTLAGAAVAILVFAIFLPGTLRSESRSGNRSVDP